MYLNLLESIKGNLVEASQLDTSLYKSQTKINATAITRSQTHTYKRTYRCKQCYIHTSLLTKQQQQKWN